MGTDSLKNGKSNGQVKIEQAVKMILEAIGRTEREGLKETPRGLRMYEEIFSGLRGRSCIYRNFFPRTMMKWSL